MKCLSRVMAQHRHDRGGVQCQNAGSRDDQDIAYGGVGQRWPDRNQHEQHDEPEHDDEGDRAKPVALVHPVNSLVDRHDDELFPGNGRHGPSQDLFL